jgi:hypothetical protein
MVLLTLGISCSVLLLTQTCGVCGQHAKYRFKEGCIVRTRIRRQIQAIPRCRAERHPREKARSM